MSPQAMMRPEYDMLQANIITAFESTTYRNLSKLVSISRVLKTEGCFDVRLHGVGIFLWAEAFDRTALFVHQEFRKVPFDSVEQSPTLSLLEILPQGMGIGTIDFDFLKKVKSDSVRFGGIFLNIGVGSWLLTPELVTGEAEDLQTRFSVLTVQSL